MNERASGQPVTASRRHFLKTGTAVVGGSLLGSLAIKLRRLRGGSDVIKVGLVGCGGRGTGPPSRRWPPTRRCTARRDGRRVRRSRRAESRSLNTGDRSRTHRRAARTALRRLRRVQARDRSVRRRAACARRRTFGRRTQSGHRGRQARLRRKAGRRRRRRRSLGDRDLPTGRGETAVGRLRPLLALRPGHAGHVRPRFTTASLAISSPCRPATTRTACGCTRASRGWSDMEWQIRNWLYFTWLSGDFNVEQHVHSLDKTAWAMQDQYPVACSGTGGRQTRTGPEYGNIFDHMAVVYEYPNGVKTFSRCRQQDGCSVDVNDHIFGTKGRVDVMKHVAYDHDGKEIWRYQGSQGEYVPGRAQRTVRQHSQRQADQQRPLHGPQHDDGHPGPHGRLHGTEGSPGSRR